MAITGNKYYQLVLLWITDQAKFQKYLHYMAPVVTKYGGEGDRIIKPSLIWAEGMELPHMVNLVHYDNREAYENFNNDPEFKKIVHLRSESTRIISFEGYLAFENASAEHLTDREYNVEIVNFKNGSADAYKKYETEGESKMKDYGFVVEYKIAVDTHSLAVQKPDLIKISYFKTANDKINFEKDPSHKTIEQELYPNAIDKVIWISGKSNPV